MYNLIGSIAPMFGSIVTVPIYLHFIGTAAYGVLAIVWMFLGYFGVFDPGLGRATAYTIARLKDEPPRERQEVFWTALTINAAFGVAGGLLLYFVAQPVFEHLFKMSSALRSNIMVSLPWLAVAVPVGTVAGVFSGTLEGLRKFGLINAINFFGTLAFQLIPLTVCLLFGRDLTRIIGATVLVRMATAVVFLFFAINQSKAGWPRMASSVVAKRLFSYGSWISVSNFIVPFLATLDKMIIGSYLGVVDVAIYTIPDNLTRRISIIPGALSRSLFPKISSENAAAAKGTFERSFRILLAVMTPICVAGVLGMTLFLRIWVGSEIGQEAAPIGIILLLAIYVNSLAYLPCMYLQATGRPHRNAQFHLIEIGPHVVFLILGIHFLGLIGVALAMLFVSAFDAALLFWAADMKVWEFKQFKLSIMFIIVALSVYFIFPFDCWESYVVYTMIVVPVSIACIQMFQNKRLTFEDLFLGIHRLRRAL